MGPLSKISTPAKYLCLFLFIVRSVDAAYGARGLDSPPWFQLLYALGWLWVVGWWFEDDARKHGFGWFHDLGLFVGGMGILFVPYHLFKTRGTKGLVTIFCYFGLEIAAYLFSLAVFFLLLRE